VRRTVNAPLGELHKRDDINAARPFGGLRVLFDTRYVNDERACRAVGQNASDEAGGPIKVRNLPSLLWYLFFFFVSHLHLSVLMKMF
jgi:hypothetical protein